MSRTKIERYMNILDILDNEDFLTEDKQQYYNYIMHAVFEKMPSLEYYE